MTRARVIVRRQVPDYYTHAAKLKASGVVLHGPHFDLDPHDIDSLRDPFKVARPFAHAMAVDLGEAYAWGWWDTPEGAVPAVVPVGCLCAGFRMNGRTG